MGFGVLGVKLLAYCSCINTFQQDKRISDRPIPPRLERVDIRQGLCYHPRRGAVPEGIAPFLIQKGKR